MGRRLVWLIGLAVGAFVATSAAADPAYEVLVALNAARTERGLEPVVERRELTAAARAHTADMVERRYFALEPPGTAEFRDHLVRAGYVPALSRMLLTAGYPDAELLIEGLLGADATYNVLMEPNLGEVGIAHSPGPYRDATDHTIITHAWLLVLSETRFTPVAEPFDRLAIAINQARSRLGLPAVRPVPALSAAAMDHARDMVSNGYFDHRSPIGSGPADRASRHHYPFRKIGENLAAGQDTADGVVQGWTDSPGHARILYDPDLQDLGIGYLPGPIDEPTRSLRHIWVAVFGRSR